MRFFYFLCFGIFLSLGLIAQEKPNKTTIPGTDSGSGNAKVSGVIINEESGEPVEFATVSISRRADNKPIDGTVTDDKGKFTLNKVPAGEFKLVISFIGYEPNVIDPFVIKDKDRNINLGTVKLKSDSKVLDEIVVEDQRELIEDRIDRLVYNAEQDLTNSGGDAGDVLRKVPMLSVDLDGNVSMRGSSNVRVLINNKPSSIMASSAADALRQIPADMIKSVEVITSPSARYDAEGTAGIINIITKKNTLKGVSGTINLTGGNRSSNFSGNINYRLKKVGFTFSTGGRMYYAPFDQSSERTNFFEDFSSTVSQTNSGRSFGIFGNTRFGFDYDINKNNIITAGVRVGYRNRDSDNLLLNTVTSSEENSIINSFSRDFENLSRNYSADFNIDYIKTFKNPKQELSILTLFSRDIGRQDYDLDQFNTNNELTYQEINQNDNTNQEMTVQVDYVHPFSDAFKFETGAKGIMRTVGSDFELSNFNNDEQSFQVVPERSNEFSYDQNVYAAYVSFDYTTPKKYAIQMGLRYERTDIIGRFITDETRFTQDYDNFIPNLILSKEFKKGQRLKFSYNRRIQRPSIFFLNPFVDQSDTLNISFGNPQLDPELTNSYEMSFSIFKRKFSINTSVYWRQTDNVISAIRFNEDNVQITTYDNVAKNDTYGASIFGSVNPTKTWRISGNVNVYYVNFESPEFPNAEANVAYNFRLNSSFKFKKGWSAEFFGFFNSPRVEVQGLRGSFSFYSMGVKKELFKKKGNLTLSVANPFANTLKIRSTFSDDSFTSENVREIYLRSIRLSFGYKFGNNKNPRRRRSRGVSNDDVKQGESNEQ